MADPWPGRGGEHLPGLGAARRGPRSSASRRRAAAGFRVEPPPPSPPPRPAAEMLPIRWGAGLLLAGCALALAAARHSRRPATRHHL